MHKVQFKYGEVCEDNLDKNIKLISTCFGHLAIVVTG